ncbi:MAG: metallophosphoesterase-domain-containing protein [Actinomycetia bacterium]|nr:metallophosphoesterase-domain-containing protein [Actinomycetes bacterium]MCP4962316.1 metallophosphoesterase-domain-containing protein [Actinomycetes bacterium]
MPESLHLALVTDIHNGRKSLTKRGSLAIPLLDRFAEFLASEAPDLVIELGDRVTDTNHESDRAALEQVAETFASLEMPRFHLMGNHDLVNLSLDDNRECLGQDLTSSSLDIKGWHLVLWQADVEMTATHEPALTDDDLAWLEADLAATDLPAIVFSHVPLDGASMTGNFYFQANPQFGGYRNVDEAQRIISEAQNVALCVAGHVHWNNISRIDGVPYISLQSLTESFTTQGDACASWATLELGRRLRWIGHGEDPIEVTVELGAPHRRWTPPLPPFAELERHRSRTG